MKITHYLYRLEKAFSFWPGKPLVKKAALPWIQGLLLPERSNFTYLNQQDRDWERLKSLFVLLIYNYF